MADQTGSNGSAQVLGEKRTAMLEAAAARVGITCIACGQVISGPGFEFVSLQPIFDGGEPRVREGHIFICDREECAPQREEARQKSTAWRPTASGWNMPTTESESVSEHEAHGDV